MNLSIESKRKLYRVFSIIVTMVSGLKVFLSAGLVILIYGGSSELIQNVGSLAGGIDSGASDYEILSDLFGILFGGVGMILLMLATVFLIIRAIYLVVPAVFGVMFISGGFCKHEKLHLVQQILLLVDILVVVLFLLLAGATFWLIILANLIAAGLSTVLIVFHGMYFGGNVPAQYN